MHWLQRSNRSPSTPRGSAGANPYDDHFLFGDVFVFSGINNLSTSTYLSLRGPGLPDSGIPLTDPMQPGARTVAPVRENGPWIVTWDSADLSRRGIEWFAGEDYIVDACADTDHCVTRGFFFTQPYIVGYLNASDVVEGEDLVLSGWARSLHDPQRIYVWIFGSVYHSYGNVVTLDQAGHFEYVLPTTRVARLAAGEYQLLVQHPMENRQSDVTIRSGTVVHLPGDEWVPEGQDVDLAERDPADAITLLRDSFRSDYCDQSESCDDKYIVIPFSIVQYGRQPVQSDSVVASVVPPASTTTMATPETTEPTGAPSTTVTETPGPVTVAVSTTPIPTWATSATNPVIAVLVASIIAVPFLLPAISRIIRRR